MKHCIGIIVLFFSFTPSISLNGMEAPAEPTTSPNTTSPSVVLQSKLALITHLALKLYNKTGQLTVPSFCDFLGEHIIKRTKRSDAAKEDNKQHILNLLKQNVPKTILVNSEGTKNALECLRYTENEHQICIFQTVATHQNNSLLEKLTANTKLNRYKKSFVAGSLTTLAVVGVIWSLPKLYHWLRP